jgi:hypothetical protein
VWSQVGRNALKAPFVPQPFGGFTVFLLHGLINFFSQHLYSARGGNAETHLSTTRRNDGHDDIISNGDAFPWPTRQHKHGDYRRKSSKLV